MKMRTIRTIFFSDYDLERNDPYLAIPADWQVVFVRPVTREVEVLEGLVFPRTVEQSGLDFVCLMPAED